MNKKAKKIISGLLATLMIFTSVPISTIPAITIGTNENDVNNDTWDVGIKVYDDGVLTNEIKWDATDHETKLIKIELSYDHDSSEKSYAAGDVSFEVDIPYDVIRNLGSEGKYATPTITYGSEEDWAHTVQTNSLGYPTKVIFTNNKEFDADLAFSGVLSFTMRLEAYQVVSPSTNEIQAVFKTKDGTQITFEPIPFSFTSTEVPYYLATSTNGLLTSAGLPTNYDDYYWVKYTTSYNESLASGTREAFNKSLVIEVPGDVLVFSNTLKQITTTNNKATIVAPGEYTEEVNDTTYEETYRNYTDYQVSYIIAYPKSIYETAPTTTITANLYGIYRDETETKLLTTETITKNVSVFTLDYDGKLYSIGKNGNGTLSYEDTYNDYSIARWGLTFGAIYSENVGPINMECGDDYLISQDENGDYYFLSEDEYEFTELNVDYHKAGELQYGLIDQTTGEDLSALYKADIYVKYANDNEYTLWKEDVDFSTTSTVTFPENTVRFKIILKDVKDHDVYLRCVVSAKFHSKEIVKGSKIYNFNYLKPQYNDGTNNYIDLAITEDNYVSFSAKEVIMTEDLKEYGTLMFRSYNYYDVDDPTVSMGISKDIDQTTITTDQEAEKINFDYNFHIYYRQNATTTAPSKFNGYTFYDLLPEGMDTDDTPEEIIENMYQTTISNGYLMPTYGESQNIKFNGTAGVPSTYTTYLNYMREHATATVTKNWNNTGRTMVAISFDFSDDPLNLRKLDEAKRSPDVSLSYWFFFPDIKLHCYVDFDSYLQLGTTYINTAYIGDINNDEKAYDLGYSFLQSTTIGSACTTGKDTDTLDFDQDGDTTESLGMAKLSTIINADISASTDVKKFISSDLETFDTAIKNLNFGAEYAYRIRVRTGENRSTELVIYDEIEGISTGWKGTLKEIDISQIESKGYKATVYYTTENYSEAEAYTKDITDDSWKLLTGDTDLSTVKSIAVKVTNTDGTEATFPANSAFYVELIMETPNKLFAYNSFNSDETFETAAVNKTANTSAAVWVPLDTNNIKMEAFDKTSNTVQATLPLIYLSLGKEMDNSDGNYESDAEKMGIDTSASVSFNYRITDKDTGEIIINNGTIKFTPDSSGSTTSKVINVLNTPLEFEKTYIIEELIDGSSPYKAVSITANSLVTLTKIDNNKYEFVLHARTALTTKGAIKITLNNKINTKSINLEVSKVVTGTDRAFQLINKTQDSEFEFNVNLKDKDGNIISTKIVTNKNSTVFENIYPGTYTIEEVDMEEYFKFIDITSLNSINGVTVTKTNTGATITIDNTIEDGSTVKVQFENELQELLPPEINIKVSKVIKGTDEAFENLKLDKDGEYNFRIKLENIETGEVINGIVTNKKDLIFTNIAAGKYKITELDDNYFDFDSMKALNSIDGVTFTKEGNDYIIDTTNINEKDQTLQIEVTNTIEPTRYYEGTNEKINLLKFKYPEAYAVYTEEDSTLTFVRSETTIEPGDIFDNKEVTAVYTGFETENYNAFQLPESDVIITNTPWDGINPDKVIVRDKIQPTSTEGWFANFYDCTYMDLSNLDTSNVTSMGYMFAKCYSISNLNLNTFNTSKVTNMINMFNYTGKDAENLTIDVSNWEIMEDSFYSTFYQAGYNSKSVQIIGLDTWNMKNITAVWSMFQFVGYNAESVDLGDLSKWNVSNIIDFSNLFSSAGAKATIFNIGDISNWDVSSAISMGSMFYNTAPNANYSLDLSNWNVSKVTDYSDFNKGTETQINPPIWVN